MGYNKFGKIRIKMMKYLRKLKPFLVRSKARKLYYLSKCYSNLYQTYGRRAHFEVNADVVIAATEGILVNHDSKIKINDSYMDQVTLQQIEVKDCHLRK